MNTKKITLPTIVTCVRIALTPFIVQAMIAQAWPRAFWLFVIAALTDTIDGNLARWLGEQTVLGAMLDPIADKILLLSCFFTLSLHHASILPIPTWFCWLIMGKEFLIFMGTIGLFTIRPGVMEIRPTMLGKMTTVMQMFFVSWIFVCHFFNWWPLGVYYVLLFGLSGLVIASLVQYAQIGLRTLFVRLLP